MKKPTFAEMIDRTHLKRLEREIMTLTFDLEQEHGCGNMQIVYALVSAAYELARRGSTRAMDESFDHHVIEQCERNLGRLRSRYS